MKINLVPDSSRTRRAHHYHHELAPSDMTRPAKRRTERRNDTLSKDTSKGRRVAKVRHRGQIGAKTHEALIQAAEVAKEKDLERALGGLNLNVSDATPNVEQPRPPPVLLAQDFDPLTGSSIASQYTGTFTSPRLRKYGPCSSLTELEKAIDNRTAMDVEAYEENPNVILPRKRQTRVMDALFYGRTDLNAMRFENHCKQIEEAEHFNDLSEKRDVYRPQHKISPKELTERRDLHRPWHERNIVNLSTGKRDLHEPEGNPRRVALPPIMNARGTTDTGEPTSCGTAPLFDSYRPARDGRNPNREFGSVAKLPRPSDDSHRPYQGRNTRPLRSGDESSDFVLGRRSGMMIDSYRPNKRDGRRSRCEKASGKERIGRGAAHRTRLVDSYRPADNRMDMELSDMMKDS